MYRICVVAVCIAFTTKTPYANASTVMMAFTHRTFGITLANEIGWAYDLYVVSMHETQFWAHMEVDFKWCVSQEYHLCGNKASEEL